MASCNSLDSGKDSASEEQLLRSEEEEISTIQTTETVMKQPATQERSRKTHWKSQSMGEVMNNGQNNGDGDLNSQSSFSQNRELWQRRAASQSQLQPSSSVGKDIWEMRQKHTPDLVMDLPLVGSTETATLKAGNDSPTGPESPDMTTAAERFAKQNQCTLKKNTKSGGTQSRQSSNSSQDGKESETKSTETPPPLQPKPQIKTKPQLMRKPVITGHHPSPHLIRKDNTQTN